MCIIYIIILFFVCIALFKPGFKFFLLWLGICAAVFCFLDMSAGLWGVLIYVYVWSHDEPFYGSSDTNYHSDTKSSSNVKYSGKMNNSYTHGGTSYNSGDVTYYSNGNSSVHSGNVSYFSNGSFHVKSIWLFTPRVAKRFLLRLSYPI